MRPIATVGVGWSVILSVMTMSPAKTVELREIPFVVCTRVFPRNYELAGVQIPP